MTSRLVVDLARKSAVSEDAIRKFWKANARVKAKSILAKNIPIEIGVTTGMVVTKLTRLKEKRNTGKDLHHKSLKTRYNNNSKNPIAVK